MTNVDLTDFPDTPSADERLRMIVGFLSCNETEDAFLKNAVLLIAMGYVAFYEPNLVTATKLGMSSGQCAGVEKGYTP